MRVALLLTGSTEASRGTALAEEACSAATEEGDWTGTSLAPLDGRLPAERAIPLALGLLDSFDTAGTVLLRVSEFTLVPGPRAPELDAAFEQADGLANNSIEAVLSEAFARQSEGDFDSAFQQYQAAEVLLRGEVSPRRVLVLVSLAEIERQRGNRGAAALLLDRALALSPEHRGALETRAQIATEAGEAATAAALLERLVPMLGNSAERVEALRAIAEQSLTAARLAITYASELIPGSIFLLERLQAVHEAASQWDAAVSVAVQIAEQTHDPVQRARVLVDAARLCAERAHNVPRAVALYEAAIADDPEVTGAFDAIEAELLKAGDPQSLAAAYQRQISRLEATGIPEKIAPLLRKLATLEKDGLGLRARAIATLERLTGLLPTEIPARIQLSELLEGERETTRATRVLEAIARLAPARPDTYRSLCRVFTLAGDEDRVYSACSVLVALGEADLDEQLTFAQHRPEALPPIRAGLDAEAWLEILPEEHLSALDAIAAELEPLAIHLLLAEARNRSGLTLPSPKDRVDLQKTTVSAVRCFTWAASLVGLPEPEIYIQPSEARIGVRQLPEPGLALALGRPVLTGRTVGELAFLAARHLTYARPGWRMLSLFSTLEELRSFLIVGMAAARPEVVEVAGLGAQEQTLAAHIAANLTPEARERVGQAVEQILSQGGTLDVLAWMRSIESAACRVGLLACGDVTLASTVLAMAGAAPGGLTARERARALLPFCVSQRHAALRLLLGVAVG